MQIKYMVIDPSVILREPPEVFSLVPSTHPRFVWLTNLPGSAGLWASLVGRSTHMHLIIHDSTGSSVCACYG